MTTTSPTASTTPIPSAGGSYLELPDGTLQRQSDAAKKTVTAPETAPDHTEKSAIKASKD